MLTDPLAWRQELLVWAFPGPLLALDAVLPLGIGVGWGTADRAWLSGKGVLYSRKPAAATTDALPMGRAFCGLLNPIPSSSWFTGSLSNSVYPLGGKTETPSATYSVPWWSVCCWTSSYLAQPFLIPYHRSPCRLPARRQSTSLPLLLTSPSNSLLSGGLFLPFVSSFLPICTSQKSGFCSHHVNESAPHKAMSNLLTAQIS